MDATIKRYTAKELKSFRLNDLDLIGDQLGLTFGKNHTKAERAKRILTAYATQDAQEGPHDGASPDGAPTPGGPRPDFERLIDGGPGEGEAADAPQRGGARPGAGRPEGMTNDLAMMNRLSKQPHPFLQYGLEMLFRRWAASVKVKEVALSKEEAFALALSWTQMGDYFGVTNRIPIWAQLGITMIWTTANIVGTKAEMIREARKPKEPAVPVESLN